MAASAPTQASARITASAEMPASAAPLPTSAAATAEAPAGQASTPLLPASATTKPFIEDIRGDDTAKLHLNDQVITNTVRMDPAYITSPSNAIRSIYESFASILDAQGTDISSRTQDSSLIEIVNWAKRASVMKSSMPDDITQEKETTSFFMWSTMWSVTGCMHLATSPSTGCHLKWHLCISTLILG